MDELFGLPAHPLLVHAAVVLVPLATIGVLIGAVWPAGRRRLAIATLVVASGGLVASFLAGESGESLEERVRETDLVEEHAEMGETGSLAAAGAFIGALGLAAVDLVDERRADRGGLDTRAVVVVGVVAVLLSVAGTAQIVRIGHSGAEATWDDLPAGTGD